MNDGDKFYEGEKISEEGVSEILKNSENSQISAYHKDTKDDRICKFCEFFGCEGDCDQAKVTQQNIDQKKKAKVVKEEGIEYMQNELGLIDLKKTEKLFLKRNDSNSP